MMLKIKRLLFLSVFFTLFFMVDAVVAQKINQFNAEGKRVGFWKKYYKNGRLRYTGQFENGKEVGTFMFFDMTSSEFPTIIKVFNKNSDIANVQYYTTKGKITSRGDMKGRRRVGKWTYYFPNKRVLSEEHYLDGKLNGMLKNYYPNGKVTEETYYKNGKKEGVSKKFSDDGILIEEITYKNDKENGIAKFFDLKGNLKETGEYRNGKRHGKWEFYVDGEVISEKDKRKSKTHTIQKKQ